MRPNRLSKEAVQRTIEPHWEYLGKADRDRLKSLMGVMQGDGGILLSSALNTLYPSTTTNVDNYDAPLAAFRQFRLRLKTFADERAIHFILKSDTQTRTKPDERWCWFEGDDRSEEDIARFSRGETDAVNRIKYPIQQMAIAVKLGDHLPDAWMWSDINNPQSAYAYSSNEEAEAENYRSNKDVVAQRILEDILKRMTPAHYYSAKARALDSHKKKAPSTENQQRLALEHLEEWVKEGTQPYCALLGEYGMGKTTSCMLFTQLLLEKRQSQTSLPLPIYLDLRNIGDKDQCSEMGLVALIDTVLKNSLRGSQSEEIVPGKEIIRLVQEEGALVIFDGLDEVLVHLSLAAGQQFTRKLLSILYPRKKASMGRVLITCRTHYFRTMREQKAHFTTEDRGGIMAEDFCAIVLLPFVDEQIHEYLVQSLPDFDINTLIALIRSVHNLSELAERPYTLSLIPDLIPHIERWKKEGSQVTGATIYRHMVLSWLERDSGKHRLLTDHKLQLMEYFSAELWRSGKTIWSVSDVENWLVHFLRARPDMEAHYTLGKGEELLRHVLEVLKEDLRTATFLVGVGDGDFRFAHTSLQEFFLATYLHRALQEGRAEAWDMPLTSKETLDFLGQLLSEGEDTLEPALTMLRTIRDGYRPRISELAFAYMLLAHTKEYPTPVLAGCHLEGAHLKDWSIAGKPGQLLNLRGASFRGATLDGADLHYCNSDHVDFSDVQLVNAEFLGGRAQAACFEGANLVGARFRDMKLQKAVFANVKLHRTQWVRCQLDESLGLDSNSANAIFASSTPREHFDHTGTEGRQLMVFDGHQAPVCSCIFSLDGQQLLSASDDQTLRVWDTTTGECLRVFSGHQGRVRAAVFSPNEQTVASVSTDHTVRLWDAVSCEVYQVLRGHEGWVNSCAFSPDGQQLVSSSRDKTLRIWDATTGACLQVLDGHEAGVNDCVFSPSGQLLISASSDKTLRVWETATGECVQVLRGHQEWVNNCAFSPDGSVLVSAAGDKTLRVWDVATGECLRVLKGHKDRVRSCAFSPDGRQLASTSADQTIYIWDVGTWEYLKVLRGHQGKVRDCAFSSDGRLASVSWDQTIRIWDVATGRCQQVFGSHQGVFCRALFSPNGQQLVSSSGNGCLHVWNAVTGECLQVLNGHKNVTRGCAFSSDGQQLVSASWDRTLRLWDVMSGECLKVLSGHEDRVEDCVFFPDGKRLVSGSMDQTLRLWDSAKGECLKVLFGHHGGIRSCAFSAEALRFVSASEDQTLRIWDSVTSECLHVLSGHEDVVRGCAFSPDGQLIASASHDETLRIWNAKTGKCLKVLKGHEGRVRACTFSPDGRWLVSAASDQTLRVWDVASGACQKVLCGHQNWVSDCAFSPDGQWLASVSIDGSLRVWDMERAEAARFRVHSFSNGAWASITAECDRVIQMSGEVWRWLGWFIPHHEGKHSRYPLEILG